MVIMCTIKGNGVTSCRAICLASTLLIFPGPTHHRAVGIQTSEIVSPKAVIETDPNLVLGFPAVVKVRFTGPVRVPDLLASRLKDFPIKRRPGRFYSWEQIDHARQWIVQQKEWEIESCKLVE